MTMQLNTPTTSLQADETAQQANSHSTDDVWYPTEQYKTTLEAGETLTSFGDALLTALQDLYPQSEQGEAA